MVQINIVSLTTTIYGLFMLSLSLMVVFILMFLMFESLTFIVDLLPVLCSWVI